jgi:hypothetical protein
VVKQKLSDKGLYKLVVTSEKYARIFYRLALYPNSTEELAEDYKVGIGTMRAMLSYLLKVGLIKETEGKWGEQFYEVDWDGFFLVYGYEIPRLSTKYRQLIIPLKEKADQRQMNEISDEAQSRASSELSIIVKNPTFRNFLEAQVKAKAFTLRIPFPPIYYIPSIEEFIDEVNIMIVNYDISSIHNKELKHLLEKFIRIVSYSGFDKMIFHIITEEVDKQGELGIDDIKKTLKKIYDTLDEVFEERTKKSDSLKFPKGEYKIYKEECDELTCRIANYDPARLVNEHDLFKLIYNECRRICGMPEVKFEELKKL